MKQKGFTLIELLVVVAIIGILAAVGVVAYSGYTQAAKRNVTLAQHKKIEKYIRNTLQLCEAQGGGTFKLSNTRTINCNTQPNAGGINTLNAVFIGHFLDIGFKNPYGDTNPVVYTARNGTNDFEGRMRFDETECSSNPSRKQIALWVKTHVASDYKPVLIAKDGWCNK